MKELSTEEKAKRYDDRLEKAKKWYDANTNEGYRGIFEDIFPELKGSEDEKIKEIIKKVLIDVNNGDDPMLGDKETKKCIAWLKKQGDQKPADKVEPKFKVGDWVIYDHRAYQVVELPKEGYINLGLRRNGKIEFAPSTYCKHWTIQDAKDGDVLYSPCCKLLWIYKDEKTCHVGSNLNYNSGSIVINKPVCTPTDVHPATKEQRTQLEKAMTDAGWEFDFDKKELKKIEQKPTDDDIKEVLRTEYEKGRADVIAEIQKEWSEEDESNFQNIDSVLFCEKNLPEDTCMRLRNWLESLKERVQPETVKWSEEDDQYLLVCKNALAKYQTTDKWDACIISNWLENKLKSLKNRVTTECSEENEKRVEDIIYFLDTAKKHYASTVELDACINWLKSLRPQSQWRPSDEQMDALQYVYRNCKPRPSDKLGWDSIRTLELMYQDLKKLKEK